jgi:hypothetical protein
LRPILISTVPILGLLLALSFAWIGGHDTVRSDIAACISRDCFDRESADQLKDTIEPFIRGSRYEGKLNIDSAPREDFLNFYVTKSSPMGRLASIRCNCAFVGFSSVVCDKSFLSSFSNTLNFTRSAIYGKDADEIWQQEKAVFEQVNKRIGDVMKSWLLGHEVAHAILHGQTNFGRRKAFTQKQELEADHYFIERSLVGADKQRIQNISSGLTQLIFAVVGIAMNTLTAAQDNPGKAIIAPSTDGIHPPWLIRALELAKQIGELGQTDGKADEFYGGLSKLVVMKKGGVDVGTLCDSENLREIQAHLQEQRIQHRE